MALEALFELKASIEDKDEEALPPNATNVQQRLNELAEKLTGCGPEPRQEILDADGYSVIVEAWKFFCYTGERNIRVLTPEAELTREASLKALSKLSIGFPNIVDDFGFIMIVQAFYNAVGERTKIYGLKFMRNICIKNEANRERLAFEYHIGEPFVHLIKIDSPSAELIREWCGALATFTLSDDETVVFNRSPERKRLIYQHQAYQYLCAFLHAYEDEKTLNYIVNALAIIATNEDFCVAIESSGGLKGLERILEIYDANMQLIKNTIICLRYMFMSGIVREKSGSTRVLKLILHLTIENQENPDFLEIAISCLAFLTLHNPCACAQLLIEKGVHSIIEIMRLNLDEEAILKSSCLILRNVAAIGGKIGKLTILDAGGEALLREIGQKFDDLVENHINPTLRDLGLNLIAPPSATGEETTANAIVASPTDGHQGEEAGALKATLIQKFMPHHKK